MVHLSRLRIDVAVRLLEVRRWIATLLNVCAYEARDHRVSLIVQHKQEGGLDGDTVRLSPPKKTEVASGHDRSSRRERRVFRSSPLINSSVSPQLSTLPWEPHFLPRLYPGFELR